MKSFCRWLGWASLAALLATWITIAGFGDRVWWSVPLLYGPRWVPSLAFLGMVPWLITARRRAVLPFLVGAGVVLFGILDFRLGLARFWAGSGMTLRVMEINAGDGGNVARVVNELLSREADIVVIPECALALSDSLRRLPGFDVRNDAHYLCAASRFPIRSWEVRDPSDLMKLAGAGIIVRAEIETPAGAVRLGLVHLETPRNALGEFADLSRLPDLAHITRENIGLRILESHDARAWITPDSSLPLIVVGDFNLPVESVIYRTHWGDLRNAFSSAGFGTGRTKRTRWWGVRIDHVLTSGDFGVARCFLGTDVGADHLPLIADLVLATPQRTRTTR